MVENIPIAKNSNGCFIIDENGKKYLDGSGGAAVSCLGHSNEKIINTLHKQLDQLPYAHTKFFSSKPAEELANKIISYAPKDIEHMYLVSGGSEAIEAGIKLARQYCVEIGETNKRYIIARKQSYHGNTLGALACGGDKMRRKMFEPLLIETSHISPCYEYRNRQNNETAQEYGIRTAEELETEILRLGKENVMAFVAETVAGATLGCVPPVKGYFKRVKEICEQYDILLILDEVMCGIGRTGTLFACEQENISADIICIAKGLGAGYQPIGAMMCSGEIYQTIKKNSGAFQHGHTYLAHPMAAAAANTVLEVLIDDGVLNEVTPKGEMLQKKLVTRLGQHENVGDIRGRGLFRGIELVKNRESKEPFEPDRKIYAKIKRIAQEKGLLCYPTGGTIDGVQGDHVLLAPPYIISEKEMDLLVDILAQAIDEAVVA